MQPRPLDRLLLKSIRVPESDGIEQAPHHAGPDERVAIGHDPLRPAQRAGGKLVQLAHLFLKGHRRYEGVDPGLVSGVAQDRALGLGAGGPDSRCEKHSENEG